MPASRSLSPQRSTAKPLPMLPRLSCTPGARKRIVRRPASSSTSWLPTCVRASASRSGCGNGAGAAGEAPGLPERAGGDVIGPARLVAQPHGKFQEPEQPRLDFHRPLGRRRIDPRQFALAAKDRQLAFQLLDQVEGLQGGFRAVGILARAEGDLELAGHGGPRYPHQVRLAVACHRRCEHVQRFQLDQLGQAGLGQLAAGNVAARLDPAV